MPSVSRRKFLFTTGIALGAVVFTEDAVIREPNHPELVRLEMPLARLPAAMDGFTIAQLSDFHYDPIFSVTPIRRAMEIVNGLHPDIVVLTGDFVTIPIYALHDNQHAAKAAAPCAKLLSGLTSRMGSIAVLGNHDVHSDPELVTQALEDHGIRVLCNRSLPIEQNGSRFWICGLDSADRAPDLQRALDGVPQTESVVLLIHEPDFADKASAKPIDLQLSGLSHGGQIWLPGIGAPWLPPFARKYPRGRYNIRGLPLYTNIGLGTIRLPIRLNCTPEVTLITLRSHQASESDKRSVYTSRDSV